MQQLFLLYQQETCLTAISSPSYKLQTTPTPLVVKDIEKVSS